ncbi:MAG: GGDEF domain-containing protein [Candidatus Micrarchaeota archaeon]
MAMQICTGDGCEPVRQLRAKLDDLTKKLTKYGDRLLRETALRKKAEDAAMRDSVTGAFNRRGLEYKFGEELSRQRRSRKIFCIIFVDVDDFGAFNKRYGEHTGDNVLRGLVEAVRGCLRGYDSVCRIGGDEFVVLLPESQSLVNACTVAERIRRRIEAAEVMSQDGKALHISISIGVAALDGTEDLQELIDRANSAEMAAKNAGKGAVFVFVDGKAQEAGIYLEGLRACRDASAT